MDGEHATDEVLTVSKREFVLGVARALRSMPEELLVDSSGIIEGEWQDATSPLSEVDAVVAGLRAWHALRGGPLLDVGDLHVEVGEFLS